VNLDDLELELRKLPGVRAAGFTERDDVLLIQLQVSGGDPPPNLTLQATRIAYRHADKPVALEVVRWRVAPDGRDQPAIAAPIDGALSSRAGIAPIDQEHAPPAPLPSGPDAEPAPVAEATEPEPAPELASPEVLGADEPPVEAQPAAEPTPTLDETVVDAPPELVVDEPPIAPAAAAPAAPVAPSIVIQSREQRVRLLAVLTFPDTDELEVHLTFEGRRIIGRAVASNGILGVVEAMVDGLKVFVPRLEFSPSWARELDDERDLHLVAVELLALDSRRLGIAAGASAIEAAARATLHALNRSIAKHLAEDTHSPAID
jgi:hypothetical protein